MQTPSGVVLADADLRIIRRMGSVGFVVYKEKKVTLASGAESHFYINGRQDLTDNPDLECLIGEKIASTVYKHFDTARQPCLIGVPVCGNTLAQAGSTVSYMTQEQPVICHRVMREQKKEHGSHTTWIYGEPDLDRHEYWFVDNVVTSGGSFIKAADRAAEDGYPSRIPCLILIDRQQGGTKRMRAAGFEKVVTIYNFLDIAYVFGEMGVWPKESVAQAEEENAKNQFV